MRFRLYPTPVQEAALLRYCAHSRYVWNLAVEQQSWWRQGRDQPPNRSARSRQLTDARAEFGWLRSTPRDIEEQALNDFDRAMAAFFRRTHRRPAWRKADRHESFRVGHGLQRDHIRRLNRRWGEVYVPRLGHVRFRWTRSVGDARSYRVTRDAAGRWHVAFALIPDSIPAPGNGEVVGVDRGVAVAAALSTGELLAFNTEGLELRARRAGRHLSRCKRGSNRRQKARRDLARVHARRADARKDWVEKLSTRLAREFDLIRVEDLRIRNMVRANRGLSRGILDRGWGLLVTRLEQKAPGRVEKVNPAYTSQRCSGCGTTDREARESQAVYRCRACGYTDNADVNAAKNIAAGHVVTARGGSPLGGPSNREPALASA